MQVNETPPICTQCKECFSDLAESPNLHVTPKEHDFVQHDVETDEGMKYLSRCRYCHKTLKEIHA